MGVSPATGSPLYMAALDLQVIAAICDLFCSETWVLSF